MPAFEWPDSLDRGLTFNHWVMFLLYELPHCVPDILIRSTDCISLRYRS